MDTLYVIVLPFKHYIYFYTKYFLFLFLKSLMAKKAINLKAKLPFIVFDLTILYFGFLYLINFTLTKMFSEYFKQNL